VTESPHGIVVQSGIVHATHASLVQTSLDGQLPQPTVPPQPLATVPHVLPWQAAFMPMGVQHVLASHVCPVGQVPQA
jgi:hypothetical protein